MEFSKNLKGQFTLTPWEKDSNSNQNGHFVKTIIHSIFWHQSFIVFTRLGLDDISVIHFFGTKFSKNLKCHKSIRNQCYSFLY